MDSRFFSFVWRYSKRDQLIILGLTVISFPLVYLSLEIPKIIINEAISGTDFPRIIWGFLIDQVPYLLLLCGLYLLLVVTINAIKWVLNVQVGMTGERMLRRLRYMLFERVMRFRIVRFRSTKPGEVIQSIMGEIEPLGGFIGEVLSTPCYQGGLLIVYVTFIFMQDWVLGLAAISLYPIQAFIIPILQKKIVRLNKERAANSRVLADTIGETVNVIGEVHTNDTARWHMAQVSARLYENTAIRLQLFRRKFTIKFLNNFMNHLTPFFFYSAGGYLVIQGDLDFGSLVAVLAAYKDVAAPWKAVLNYVQRWTDFNSRYVFVVENFSGDDVLPETRVYQETEQPLDGPLEYQIVEGGPGTSGLTVSSLTIKAGQMVAVRGGASGGREALLRMAAGLLPPFAGRVSLGGRAIVDCSLPQIGEAISYVGSEPGIIAQSMRANLLYGLMRGNPDLASQDDAELADMLREARLTGNTTSNPTGDWVRYDLAGVDDAQALDRRLLDLIETVGLSSEIYSNALDARLDAARAAEWTEPMMAARAKLRSRVTELDDIVEDWHPDKFNTNGTLLENILYALPVGDWTEIADLYAEKAVREVLDEIGATNRLLGVGLDIAREFSELVDAVDETSSVLDGLMGYSRTDILAAHGLIVARSAQGKTALKDEDRSLLLKLSLGFVQVRDQLDILSENRIAEILACRKRAREILAERDDFVSFDQDRFSPARSIAGNIVHGERRYDRRTAWKGLEDMIRTAVEDAGLRDDLIRLGLTRPLGSGSGLSTSVKRRIGLVRALMKRPMILILDGIAGSDSDQDIALRAAIRQALPDSMILYAAIEDTAVEIADRIVTIAVNGTVDCMDAKNAAQP